MYTYTRNSSTSTRQELNRLAENTTLDVDRKKENLFQEQNCRKIGCVRSYPSTILESRTSIEPFFFQLDHTYFPSTC